MRKENKSRKFAFIGFKNENEAKAAKEYFNDSYIDTCKFIHLNKFPKTPYSSNSSRIC